MALQATGVALPEGMSVEEAAGIVFPGNSSEDADSSARMMSRTWERLRETAFGKHRCVMCDERYLDDREVFWCEEYASFYCIENCTHRCQRCQSSACLWCLCRECGRQEGGPDRTGSQAESDDGARGDDDRRAEFDGTNGCECARCSTWHDEPNRVDRCLKCMYKFCVYRCSDVCSVCAIVTCRWCPPCDCGGYLSQDSPRTGRDASDESDDDQRAGAGDVQELIRRYGRDARSGDDDAVPTRDSAGPQPPAENEVVPVIPVLPSFEPADDEEDEGVRRNHLQSMCLPVRER